MPKLNIAIIHGIGINTQGYADPLIKGISGKFNSELRKILKTTDDYTSQLNFIPVVWDDIVAPKEAELADIFRKVLKERKTKLISWVLLFAGMGALYFIFNKSFVFLLLMAALVYFVPRGIYQLRAGFAADFVCDITSYNEEAKRLILQRITDKVAPIHDPTVDTNLTIISHSLGTVIASDYVWESEKPGRMLTQKIFLSNFFTMGSPLPIFSLKFDGPETFNKPLTLQDPQGRWVNIYDRGDPIAYPLKPLNEAYDRVVLKDQEVHVGIFGVAHVKYWDHGKVHAIMAAKLALDWVRFNDKLNQEQLDKLYAEYDRTVGV